ncbi:hypothetical protein M404DRAFT_35970 [Pisolithus tinctorius Marx 270]|uniref:Uncharacterized protein n=1 Tax=Pisolithus tinctorius Marx 270 TaxID=870435 RepID=A0A0C3MXC3_PISTI|nr:hypothetical protein M404DRAFT_35970 [Pisolithus tinctorius Marx 270]
MSQAVPTQQTPYQGEYTDIQTFSLQSLSLYKSDLSSSTQLPPPTLLSCGLGEKEHTLPQQPKSLTVLESLSKRRNEGKPQPRTSIVSSNNPSSTTKPEVRQHFDAPLTTPNHYLSSTAPPRPYCPGLTPCPSPLCPHCLAKEHLQLWQPSPTQLRVTCVPEEEGAHTITEQQVNHILEVIGVLWAEKTKETYSTRLLTYHVFCDTHGISEAQRAPIAANTLLAFLSSCAGSYSGSALSNFMASLQAWHLLHGLPWNINPDELHTILEGASRLAPASSRRALCEPFHVNTLELFHSLMDPESLKDAAIFACLTIVFYCVACLGEFTVPVITQFDPQKHITRAHVQHLHDLSGLPVTKFHIPWTKMSPTGEDVQCTPLRGAISGPIDALERHLHLNPAEKSTHLFAWKHPTSGLHPFSKTEVLR